MCKNRELAVKYRSIKKTNARVVLISPNSPINILSGEIDLCYTLYAYITYVYVLNNDSMYEHQSEIRKNQLLGSYELKIGGPLYKVFSPVNQTL